jgi:hypothetical protein
MPTVRSAAGRRSGAEGSGITRTGGQTTAGRWRVIERLMALLFWAFVALSGWAMLALYFGWWPFGSSWTF